jgi:hypothetical protein
MIIDLSILNETTWKHFVDNVDNSNLKLKFSSKENMFAIICKINSYRSNFDLEIKGKVLRTSTYRSKNGYVRIQYDNITVDVGNKLDKNINEMIFSHLRKDNVFALEITETGEVLLPWHLIYKEIIRVCYRNDETVKKKKVLEQSNEFKILILHGKLEEDGILGFEKSKYGSDLILHHDNSNLLLAIPKSDKKINLTDAQMYDYRLGINGNFVWFENIDYETLKIKIEASLKLIGKA